MDRQTVKSSEDHHRAVRRLPREVLNFEFIFQIPPTHRLLVVRSRSRGGLFSVVYWEHEEYDAGGCLISRYTSFEEIEPAGRSQSGWRRYDAAGKLLAEEDLRSREKSRHSPGLRTA
jgi:hypothetical protein